MECGVYMQKRELKKGDVVQLSPSTSNPAFAYCMMTIDEPKSFGAQGYVQSPGIDGLAYYRASWDEMEYVGHAIWIASDHDDI